MMKTTGWQRFSAVAVAVLTLGPAPVLAQTATWDGSGDMVWTAGTDLTSWSGGTYANGNNVVFGNTGVGTVTLSGTCAPANLAFQHTTGTYQFNYTAGNVIAATGSLSLTGGGTVQFGNLGNSPAPLSLLLTWTGSTSVSGGSALSLTRPGTLGGSGQTVSLDNGTLRLGADNSGAYTVGNPFSTGSGGGSVVASYSGNATVFELSGAFSGSAPLRLQTAGSAGNQQTGGLLLSGANSGYSGAVTISCLSTAPSGVVALNASTSRFSGASSVTVRDGGVLGVAFAATDADLSNVTFGYRGGVGARGVNGSLSALSDVSQALGEGGWLVLDNRDAINNNRVSDSTTLALKSATVYVIGRNATTQTVTEDAGPITYDGGSVVTLFRSNNTANYLSLSADSLGRAAGSRGTLSLGVSGSGSALGSTANLALDANLTLAANGMATPHLVSSATHDFVTTSGSGPYAVVAFSGYTAYADQTAVTLGGANEVPKLTFSATSTGNALLQNTTAVHALYVANSHASAARGLNLNGSTLTIGSGGVILSRLSSQNVQISGTGALAFGANEALFYVNSSAEIPAPITGSGGLTKFGGGSLVISSGANAITGGFVINQGTFDASASTEANGALVTGKNTLALAPGTTVTLRSSTYGGVSGRGTLTAQSGNNGSLVVETPAATSFTFNGALQNNGTRVFSLKKTGDGTQTLGADSVGTYTGTTTVNGGTLVIDGRLNAQTATVAVGSNGALGGTGSVARNVVVDGTIAATSPSSTTGLQITGDLTVAGKVGVRMSPLVKGTFTVATVSGAIDTAAATAETLPTGFTGSFSVVGNRVLFTVTSADTATAILVR